MTEEKTLKELGGAATGDEIRGLEAVPFTSINLQVENATCPYCGLSASEPPDSVFEREGAKLFWRHRLCPETEGRQTVTIEELAGK